MTLLPPFVIVSMYPNESEQNRLLQFSRWSNRRHQLLYTQNTNENGGKSVEYPGKKQHKVSIKIIWVKFVLVGVHILKK